MIGLLVWAAFTFNVVAHDGQWPNVSTNPRVTADWSTLNS
jgi:hypothetical protein